MSHGLNFNFIIKRIKGIFLRRIYTKPKEKNYCEAGISTSTKRVH